MDIDISVLRLMEREKDLPFEVLVKAIEEALLTAYEKTDGAVAGARVELNRKSGHVSVLVPELDDEGNRIGEYDSTPEGFGRVAASTARQVIMQRLRDAEDEQKYGHFSGVEGDIVSGRRAAGPRHPYGAGRPGQDRGDHAAGRAGAGRDATRTAPGSRSTWSRSARSCAGRRWWSRGPTRGWWRSCSSSRCPEIADGTVEIKAVAREAGHRSKIAVVSHNSDVSAKGACIGPMGQRVRAVMHELNEEKIDIIDWSPDPARFVGQALSPAKVSTRSPWSTRPCAPPAWWCRTISCRWPSAARARTPGSPPG